MRGQTAGNRKHIESNVLRLLREISPRRARSLKQKLRDEGRRSLQRLEREGAPLEQGSPSRRRLLRRFLGKGNIGVGREGRSISFAGERS
mmetsp:Transcript_15590/g.52214  ORF Transcript_15590/g.52214 Transcript_15590/m.52214 type:complete len:90 (-) Transcript_15590:423-692(-)